LNLDSGKLDKGDIDGLDFWNQTVDYLMPILDKNNTYAMVKLKYELNCLF
jgi:hypothetical protein